MTDTSTADELPPQTNGVITDNGLDEEERAKMRPADIDADVREMERRKRVEMIMNSKLFREELERIIETQLKDGTGASGLLQQISDMVGVNKQAGNVFKSSSCVIPINDIRGVESMGYAKGEKILRCKLASVFRLIDLYGWTQGPNTLITARLNQDEEQFLVNPYGMLFHEITASSLIKCDMQGAVIEQGTTNFPINVTAFSLHAAAHAARPDLRCIIQVHTPSVVAVSALKHGLMPLSQESVVVGEISTHPYLGGLLDADEKDKLARNLGPINKVLLLSNQGALCGGETIEEAFFNARNIVLASESQLKILPLGLDNLVLLSDEARKKIYDAAHKAPDSSPRPDQPSILETKVERKWRVGGVEFEALMRMMDNAGFRTGYIYRHPLVKGEPPKPRSDVEVPPAVSSLGYLLEEEELYRQGIWRKLEGGRKGHDRSRWLNSPNVYQKVEILETGTPDPKKITKWVAEHGDSPNHSTGTPVKIDAALQFVPVNTNPKEFKMKQQQIKDYRRADKISAGPQSHILEGVTWEEAKKMQDATVTQTGDQVVLMGAASKGIIQRGHQHNAMVYKSPYAKNPFDSVTDEELEDYKKVVEKKTKGEYDTDYSESEGLSSAQINKRMDGMHIQSPTSETEEESRGEPQILRIETRTAPKPSQPEVVLSDGYQVLTVATTNRLLARQYQYRTNSHSGFPRGSYIVPNPVHFHVARHSHIAQIMRPEIVSVVPKFHGSFNHIRKNSTSYVTLKLKDAHSVTLDISLESLKSFIRPFARALDFNEVRALSTQGCQTSYINNFDRKQPNFEHVEYTPLYVETHTHTLKKSDSTAQFEKDILDKMQQNLMNDFDNEASTSDDTSSGDIHVFDENDHVYHNESLVDITSDIAQFMSHKSSSSSDNSAKNSCFEKSVEKTYSVEHNKEEIDDHSIVEIADQFSSDFVKVVDDFETAMSVINEVKQILSQSASGSPENESPELTDEGIGEITNNSNNNGLDNTKKQSLIIRDENLDDRVVTLGQILKDFLVKQCYEIKELVLFPEPRHDVITQKFIVDLMKLYQKLFTEPLRDEDKNEMRLSLASYVLNLLELDERFKDSDAPEDTDNTLNISDKLFSMSEFLSEILDVFYDSIDNGGFSNFKQSLSEESNAQSTPRGNKGILPDLKLDESISDEVISFKKDAKNLSESYWVTINPSPSRIPSLTPSRAVFNIDDIPLKPPEDWNIEPVFKKTVVDVDSLPLRPPSDLFDLKIPKCDPKDFKKVTILQDILLKRPDNVGEIAYLQNDASSDKSISSSSGNEAEHIDIDLDVPNNTQEELNISEMPLDHEEQLSEADKILDFVHQPSGESTDKFMSEYQREILKEHRENVMQQKSSEEGSENAQNRIDEVSQSSEVSEDKELMGNFMLFLKMVKSGDYTLPDIPEDQFSDEEAQADFFASETVTQMLKNILEDDADKPSDESVAMETVNGLVDDSQEGLEIQVTKECEVGNELNDDAEENLDSENDCDVRCAPLSNMTNGEIENLLDEIKEYIIAQDALDEVETGKIENLLNETSTSAMIFEKFVGNEKKSTLEDVLYHRFDGENSYVSFNDIDDVPTTPKPSSFSKELRTLSPIREEPKINLFDSNLSDNPDMLQESYFSTENQSVSLSDYEEFSSPPQNINSETESYNIVVCNEVKFRRGEANTLPAFKCAQKVVFSSEIIVEESDEYDEEEGDKENCSPNKRGEHTMNGDQSDAHLSTYSSSKEDRSMSETSPKKDKKKKKGLRTPSFLKKKKEKKIREAQ